MRMNAHDNESVLGPQQQTALHSMGRETFILSLFYLEALASLSGPLMGLELTHTIPFSGLTKD